METYWQHQPVSGLSPSDRRGCHYWLAWNVADGERQVNKEKKG